MDKMNNHEIIKNGVRITLPLESHDPVRLEIFSHEIDVEVDYMTFNNYCEVKMLQRFGQDWMGYVSQMADIVCESKQELIDLFVEDESPQE
jgi:hypothetical protein